MLLKKSDTFTFAKWHKTESISLEARLLQTIQNAIIASIPTKKGEEWKKKEAIVKLPKPVPHDFNVSGSEEEAERKLERAGLGVLNKINKRSKPDNNQ